MTEPGEGDGAVVRPRRASWIWLIPIASLAIGAWLLWTTLARRGPLIDVTFETAEGLKAGQSELRYKDMQMGTVESFDLSADRSKVVMHVRMTAKGEPLVREGAQFWVVKPRLFAGDITGLNTVVSGTYLEISPGDPAKPKQSSFIGMQNPPALPPGAVGRMFHLSSARLGSLSVGSPIFFREVEVGKVLDWKLVGMAQSVTLNVFVNAPYDQWVHDDSRFWNTSGIGIKLGAGGVQLRVNSMKAAFLGGLAFETPSPNAVPSEAERTFTLYPNEDSAQTLAAPHNLVMATYLTGSIGGLAPGAPVMLMGVRVGEVTAVDLQFDTDTNAPRARVAFVVENGKAVQVGSKPPVEFPGSFRALVETGLRTSLKGGNLLTGQKQLALEIENDAPPAKMGLEGDVVIIPYAGGGGGGLDELSATANQLLTKIGRMPFEDIGRHLDSSLSGVSGIVNDKALKDAVARLNGTLAAAQDFVRHVDAGATPALRRLPAIAADLQETLAQVKLLSASVSAGTAGNSKFGRDLDQALAQVADAAVSVRMVADLLSRHPEALIRGRTSRAAQ